MTMNEKSLEKKKRFFFPLSLLANLMKKEAKSSFVALVVHQPFVLTWLLLCSFVLIIATAIFSNFVAKSLLFFWFSKFEDFLL
jgi:hypothetical protein